MPGCPEADSVPTKGQVQRIAKPVEELPRKRRRLGKSTVRYSMGGQDGRGQQLKQLHPWSLRSKERG